MPKMKKMKNPYSLRKMQKLITKINPKIQTKKPRKKNPSMFKMKGMMITKLRRMRLRIIMGVKMSNKSN